MKLVSSFEKPTSDLDPAKVVSFAEYMLSKNLYSTLIMKNAQGEIVPGIASSFSWDGDQVTFTFGNRGSTISGIELTALDASRSLKRTLLLKSNMHSDLRDYLCGGFEITSIDDECDGIQIRNGKLILKSKLPNLMPHLITILENADFSIIPSTSLSSDPRNPKIISFRETSGPYYVDKDSTNGNWTLKANPNHFLYSKEMPQTISLISVSSIHGSIASALESGEIDIIPTGQNLNGESMERFRNKPANYHIHETIPIKVGIIAFSPEAIEKFSREQRHFAASVMKIYMDKFTRVPGVQETAEFFPKMSEGALPPSELAEIEKLRFSTERPTFEVPIELGATPAFFNQVSAFFLNIQNLK